MSYFLCVFVGMSIGFFVGWFAYAIERGHTTGSSPPSPPRHSIATDKTFNDTFAAFERMMNDVFGAQTRIETVVSCPICGQRNRLQANDLARASCGRCHRRLAL